jgi:hypothetical protein
VSTYYICAQGHRWQDLAACPTCGSEPATTGDAKLRRCVRPEHATKLVLSALVNVCSADWLNCETRVRRTDALSQSDFPTAKQEEGKPDSSAGC